MNQCHRRSDLSMLQSLLLAAALSLGSLAPQTAMSADDDTGLAAIEALFQKALKARDAGDYEHAISYFEGILAQRPSLGRARLELATTYAEAKRYRDAVAQLKAVLDDPATPQAVRKNVLAFLDLLKQRIPQRHRFTRSIAVGLMYDSNASAGPGSSTFPIPSGSITLVNSALKRADWAGILQLGLTHTYLGLDRRRWGIENATPVWQSGARLYTVHYKDTNRNNLDVLTLHTGPALLAADWRGSLNLQWDHIRYGADSYANFVALNPAYTLTRDHRRFELNLDGVVQKRAYTQALNDGRDSLYLSLGGSAGQVLEGDKLSLQGGLELFRENAAEGYLSNRGAEAFVGFNYLLDARTNIHGRLSRRLSRYRDTDPAFLVKRQDRLDQLVLGIKHKLPSGRLAGWEARGTLTFTRRNSNIDTYDFRRTQIALNLSRDFD